METMENHRNERGFGMDFAWKSLLSAWSLRHWHDVYGLCLVAEVLHGFWKVELLDGKHMAVAPVSPWT